MEKDLLYDDVVKWAREQTEVSASAIQFKFILGYQRANRLISELERNGIVVPNEGSWPRKVINHAGS